MLTLGDDTVEARPGTWVHTATGLLSRPRVMPVPGERLCRSAWRASSIRRHREWPACSSNAFGLEDNGRQVVLKLVPGEVAHGVEEGAEDFVGRFVLVRPNDTERALQAEQLPIP
jgi:hypothetical protein